MWLFGSSKQLHPLCQSLSLWEAPVFFSTRAPIVIDESSHDDDADDEMVLIISGLVIY